MSAAATDYRAKILTQIATYQALAMTADKIEQYVAFVGKEHALRAQIKPLSDAEQHQIARETAQRIMDYNS